MRITADQRAANEDRILAAIDRLLRGDIPPGGRCDVKTLAREAGVDRTAFYGNRPTPTCAKSSSDGSARSNRQESSPTLATPRSTGSRTRPPA